MKDFRLFDIYDFLMDEDFIRWVKEGKKADHDFWNNWLTQNPDKHIIVVEARRILESFGSERKIISETERKMEIERLMLTIKEQTRQQPEAPLVYTIKRSPKWWYAAAALLIMASTGILSFLFLNKKAIPAKYAYATITPSRRLIENVNTSVEQVSVKLTDGSVIGLAPNSRIAYANNFDSAETRDVYLSGEAFFNVTKNPGRPFRVFANEIVTKVLGTSFCIRSFEKDSAIKVIVRTGKVSVYSQAAANAKETASPNNLGGIILTPNQELVYQKGLQKFQKILLDNPVMVLPADADKTLLYDDASLVKVFNQLGGNYGINIVYDNEALKNCTITADLRNVPFYEKLDLMCKAVGAKYEVIDGQVVIQANGCE
ncbi:MAG: FecR family protein [Bacteroidota bacterium]